MEAVEYLEKYKSRMEPFLEKYFKRKIKETGETDEIARQTINIVADFTLASGKRIRPALTYYGFLAMGGQDGEEIVEASLGVELIHAFLLIHDDIIDRDEKRHGVPTVHEIYKKLAKRAHRSGSAEHFGNSMAIIAGDMAATMANEIIFNAKFPPEVIIRALDKMQKIVYTTIPGEMADIILENRGGATEEEILQMFEAKTSRYTFEGPLQLGGILAGCDEKDLGAFSGYSLPLGKAFQLRDDILGVFGDEKKLGKPVGSDITEGKQTVLLAKALERGNSQQKKDLKRLLGKKDLTGEELERFRHIIRQTGSLEYSRTLAENFVKESLDALDAIDFANREAREFLDSLARYIISREK